MYPFLFSSLLSSFLSILSFLLTLTFSLPITHLCTFVTGRTEIRIFLVLYALTLPFQLLTTGAVLEQGSTALVVLTAIHAGFVAALFWSLLANGLVATQVVEDGTLSSLIVRFPLSFLCLYVRS